MNKLENLQEEFVSYFYKWLVWDAILIDSVHLFFPSFHTQVEELYNYKMHFLFSSLTEFFPKNDITPHIFTKSLVMT